jgi:hypothetical protein
MKQKYSNSNFVKQGMFIFQQTKNYDGRPRRAMSVNTRRFFYHYTRRFFSSELHATFFQCNNYTRRFFQCNNLFARDVFSKNYTRPFFKVMLLNSGPFLRIFPWGGGIFWKGTFLWDNILEVDRNGWRPRVWPTYHAWIGGSGAYSPENFWNLKHGNAISCILSIQICSKIYAKYTCIWNKRRKKRTES